MAHAITGIILKGPFNNDLAVAYDLQSVSLSAELTLFFIDRFYIACWGKMLNIDGTLAGPQPDSTEPTPYTHNIFPVGRVVAHLMQRIAQSAEPLFMVLETNYFGGVGMQWALIFRGETLAAETTQISPGLKQMGVVARPMLDEFDTVGLGNYRDVPAAFASLLYKYTDLAGELGL